MVEIRGIYEHFKGGKYEVYGCCFSKKSSQVFVLYKPLYNDTGLWVRLYSLFFSKVEINGEYKERFSLIENTSGAIEEKKFNALHSETQEIVEVSQNIDGQFILNI